MYKKIKTHPTTLELYSSKLEAEGVLRVGELDTLKSNFQSFLNDQFEAGKTTNRIKQIGLMENGLGLPRDQTTTKGGKPP